MRAAHEHYNELTPNERRTVDDAFREVQDILIRAKLGAAGDDRAEIVVDAIARYVIDCRQDEIYKCHVCGRPRESGPHTER